MALATHLVGRASELGSVDRLLAQVGGGRIRGARARRRAGNRQDAPPRRAGRPCRRTRVPRPLGPGRGARARLAVLGLRRRARRVRPRPRPAPPRQPRRRCTGGARDRLPVTGRPRDRAQDGDPARAIPQPPRRLHAARDARADPAGGARARRRPLGGSGVGRAARRAPPPTAGRAGTHRARRAAAADGRAAQRRGRTGAPRRHDRAHRTRGAQPRGGPRADRRRSGRDQPLRGQRRQSLLPRAARAVGRPSRHAGAGPTSLRSQASTSQLRSPPRSPRSSLCSPSRHASSSRAPPSRETPSTPSWRPRPPEPPRRQRSTRSTSCCAWISSARRTFPGASGSGIRSSAARCTSRCPAAGGSARTSAAPTPSPSAARRPRRSPTTSNAPRVRATRPRLRYCERLERRRPRVHRRAPHAGSPPPSVSSRRLRPATGASSCCWPVPKRSPPPANSARATQHSSRA